MLLPKPYLSHTQIASWCTYKRGYIKRYFEGEPSYTSPEMEFGIWIEKLIQEGNLFKMPKELQDVYIDIPRGGYYQRKFVMPFSGFDFLGYVDRIDYNYMILDDYKTGKTPHTQETTDTNEQLKAYALMIREITGKIPLTRIVYLPTVGKGRDIRLTGDLNVFSVKFSDEELDVYKAKVEQVAREISEFYREWKKWKSSDL